MFRPSKNILWISLILIYVLIPRVLVFAHSGHKQEEKLRVSLPDVVAKVNGENISSTNIVRELKKTLTNYKEKGMPLSAEQERIATKKLIDNEISRSLILQRGKEIGKCGVRSPQTRILLFRCWRSWLITIIMTKIIMCVVVSSQTQIRP